MLESIIVTLFGVIFAVVGGYRYVNSFSSEDYGKYGISLDFDPDQLIIFVIGLALIIVGLCAIYLFFIKKNHRKVLGYSLFAIDAAAFTFYLARLIKAYTKHKAIEYYWAWVSATFVVLVLAILAYYLIEKKNILEKK